MNSSPKHHYRVYGLTIASEIELPELNLIATDDDRTRCDMTIRRGALPFQDDPSQFLGNIQPGKIWLNVPNVATFWMFSGTEILVDIKPNADMSLLRRHLLGTVLSFALDQRGCLMLHASATEINGHAIAIMGKSGQGKSTLIARLHQRGFPVIVDDTVAVWLDTRGVSIHRGPRELRLWPDSADFLGYPSENLPKVFSDIEKRSLCLEHEPQDHALQLTHVYALETAPHIEIEALSPQETLVLLTKNVFRIDWYSREMQAEKFERCAQLAPQLRVYRLGVPREIEKLDEVVSVLVTHALGHTAL